MKCHQPAEDPVPLDSSSQDHRPPEARLSIRAVQVGQWLIRIATEPLTRRGPPPKLRPPAHRPTTGADLSMVTTTAEQIRQATVLPTPPPSPPRRPKSQATVGLPALGRSEAPGTSGMPILLPETPGTSQPRRRPPARKRPAAAEGPSPGGKRQPAKRRPQGDTPQARQPAPAAADVAHRPLRLNRGVQTETQPIEQQPHAEAPRPRRPPGKPVPMDVGAAHRPTVVQIEKFSDIS
nr:PREDICTED: basic proline-rich protein-like isoform X1 [Megachile rotundata]XP_012148639.1 PREDICTED: basic proline-rich protein-like isoform X2 [Megachile rotundata]